MLKGKIVLIPFPFDDLKATKVRPAVCLTNSIGPHHHVVLAFITSRIPDELSETDIILDSNGSGFKQTGLHVTSTIRLHRLMKVTTSLIRRELGELSPNILPEVDNKLVKLFSLTPV